MRLHELAKEYDLNSKDLLDRLHAAKLDIKSHMSALTDEQVLAVRKILGKPKASTATTVAAPAPAPAPAPAAPATPPPAPAPVSKKVIAVKNPIIVREFAEQLGLKPNQLITELMSMNIFASINQKIEFKTAQLLAEKHGSAIEHEKKAPPPKPQPAAAPKIKTPAEVVAEMKARAPVVTFMGHVDHGKTSLMDRIRKANVAAGEAGGITQHIGAYTVTVKDKKITFLDTPGHEAFTAMRARGANLTDIVVLVVDGVDGVMPQTREAIQHAKAAKVTIMVAINKVDLRQANVDRVKRQLQAEGLQPEDWGGDVICRPVSALTGTGVDELLNMILLQAEILELKALTGGPARGYVIEAQLETGQGPVATFLIREGTLRVGDPVVCGAAWGRVKALLNDRGEKVKEAGPSDAVRCLGLPEVPLAGIEFVVYPSDREARNVSDERQLEERQRTLSQASPKRASLEDLLKAGSGPERKELAIVVKSDVQGSLEAIHHGFSGIKSDKVSLNIIYTGIGNITVNDVMLASASNAIIIGFNVSKESDVSSLSKREGVEIRLYSIIYELLDEIREAMLGLLDPVVRENVHGHAEVREVFDLGKKGKVAGCLVSDGKVTARSRARVKRRGDVLFVGAVVTLRRFQNEASEVREGQECGIRLDNFGDFQTGDIIELYDVEKIAQQL